MYKLIKSLIISFLSVFLMTGVCSAETWYVRPDGGSPSQCNGRYDAPNPDFSGQNNCAFKHPWYATGYQYSADSSRNVAGTLAGGDTLIIDGSDNAEYKFGYHTDGQFSNCYSGWTWDCRTKTLPSGTPSQPTRILGKGWDTGCTDKPELYGVERSPSLFNLYGSSNVELQCLDLTDHEDCTEFHTCNRSSYPFGEWAIHGIRAKDSSNVLVKNVDIHGFANGGVYAGRLTDWTLENFSIDTNGWVGWDGDIGSSSSNSGTMIFRNGSISYNGCAQGYPDTSIIKTCRGQSGGGYGDGLGTEATGGDWIFDNMVFERNTSDGLDLLYHSNEGSVTITGGKYSQNAGNQIKTARKSIISNVIVDAECGYFDRANYPDTVGVDPCRAMGNAMSLGCRGEEQNLSNLAVNGEGDVLILAGSGCDNVDINISNSSFVGGPQYKQQDTVAFFYADNVNPNLNLMNVSISDTKDCNRYPESCGAESPEPPTCVPDGSCNATAPACDETTTGVDNCDNACTKVGEPCPVVPPDCVYEWCSAILPICGGERTFGIDNCGIPCQKIPIECGTECPEPIICPDPIVCPDPVVCTECPTCSDCPDPIVCPEPTVCNDPVTCENVVLSPREFYRLSGRTNCDTAISNGCSCTIVDGDILYIIPPR